MCLSAQHSEGENQKFEVNLGYIGSFRSAQDTETQPFKKEEEGPDDGGSHPLIPAPELYEFEASLVYGASSSTINATQRNPV